jgi:hypothetical protein
MGGEGTMEPRIDRTQFGSVTVEGAVFTHDVIIRLGGQVKKRGHRVEAPIQPRAKVLPMLPHIPRGSVAILVLTKALRRRHHALANVDGGIPGVAAGTHRVVQLDHVDVVAALGCSWLGCA